MDPIRQFGEEAGDAICAAICPLSEEQRLPALKMILQQYDDRIYPIIMKAAAKFRGQGYDFQDAMHQATQLAMSNHLLEVMRSAGNGNHEPMKKLFSLGADWHYEEEEHHSTSQLGDLADDLGGAISTITNTIGQAAMKVACNPNTPAAAAQAGSPAIGTGAGIIIAAACPAGYTQMSQAQTLAILQAQQQQQQQQMLLYGLIAGGALLFLYTVM